MLMQNMGISHLKFRLPWYVLRLLIPDPIHLPPGWCHRVLPFFILAASQCETVNNVPCAKAINQSDW